MRGAPIVLFIALLALCHAMDLSGKQALWSGMPDYDVVSAPYVLEKVSTNGSCQLQVCDGGASIGNYYATYSDGPRILICICPNAFMNETAMAYREGQVPLAVRSSVGTITAGSNGKGGGAWTLYDNAAYFGVFVPNVFIHESAHSLDFAQGNMYGTLGLSGTDEWHTCITNSSCCPDPYAKTNEVEDWAQMTVARYWARALKIPAYNNITSCMSSQLQFAFNALPEQYQFNTSKSFFIKSYVNGTALTTTNFATDDNSPLSVGQNNGTLNQIWKIMPTAYDWYIACEMNSHKCLDNQRDTSVGKNAIITYRRAFLSSQHRFVSLGNGQYKIIQRMSGLALSTGCTSRTVSNAVYVKDDGSDCQKWLITDSAPAIVTPTNNAVTSTNSAVTSTNSAVTSTNSAVTSTNSSVTSTNNAVTSTNKDLGTSAAVSSYSPFYVAVALCMAIFAL